MAIVGQALLPCGPLGSCSRTGTHNLWGIRDPAYPCAHFTGDSPHCEALGALRKRV
jgi:hypothetical protein